MSLQQDSSAVNAARAHIEGWSNHDWDGSRARLANDVWVTATAADPNFPRTDLQRLHGWTDRVRAGRRSGKRRGACDYRRRHARAGDADGAGEVPAGRAGDDPAGVEDVRVPENPGGWLKVTARNRAFDRLRRTRVGEEKLQEIGTMNSRVEDGGEDESGIGDDRLRLIFTCCHPALPIEAQVALTLRTLCGLTTVDPRGALLGAEPAVDRERLPAHLWRLPAARRPRRRPAPGSEAVLIGARLAQASARR
jgi:hypothetical protein